MSNSNFISMKYFKLFLTVFVMAIAMNVSAQSKTTAKSKTTTTTTTAKKSATTAAKPATTTAKTATTAAKPATTTAKTATTTTTTTKTAVATKTTTGSASKPAAKKSAGSFLSTNGFTPSNHLMFETKVGGYYGTGGFGENIVLEREFHKYIAWDIFSLDFSAPFNFDAVSIGLKTGLRGYSPRFWEERMRAFTSLAMGYDCAIAKGDGGWSASHGFGLSWGIGVEILDHFQVGYALEYNTIYKSTAHFAKLTYKF